MDKINLQDKAKAKKGSAEKFTFQISLHKNSHFMKKLIIYIFTILMLFNSNCSMAQSYNNYEKHYELLSQTEAEIETGRTHRGKLCDYQPSGLYIEKGETITINVKKLDKNYDLRAMIGFKPLWGNHNTSQTQPLKSGTNVINCTKSDILYFIFVKKIGFDTEPKTVVIDVLGGQAFPLFDVDKSNVENWENDLKTMKKAPFVELVSDKAMVTIPYKAFMKSPISNIAKTFEAIHNVIDWEEELGGFDDSAPENVRTRQRLHYLVDLYSTPKEQEAFYMYMMDYVIGMKKDNFNDLIMPNTLNKEWSIWHETGHTQQQNSWTWDEIGEVNVNLFSLYVQEKFKQPCRLASNEDGETMSTFEKAKIYIANPKSDFLYSNEDEDYNELFTKLVLFYQLKAVYGWDFFKTLHQNFRKKPYINVEETSQQKVDKFIYEACVVSKNNLLPFFKKWGLKPTIPTEKKIQKLKLPKPSIDPSTVLK